MESHCSQKLKQIRKEAFSSLSSGSSVGHNKHLPLPHSFLPRLEANERCRLQYIHALLPTAIKNRRKMLFLLPFVVSRGRSWKLNLHLRIFPRLRICGIFPVKCCIVFLIFPYVLPPPPIYLTVFYLNAVYILRGYKSCSSALYDLCPATCNAAPYRLNDTKSRIRLASAI